VPSHFDDHWADANLDLRTEFAETITLNDLGRDIQATVDIPVEPISLGQIRTEIQDPQFTVMDSEILGLLDDQLITVRGLPYRVVKRLPDGTGWSVVTIAPDQAGFVNDFE